MGNISAHSINGVMVVERGIRKKMGQATSAPKRPTCIHHILANEYLIQEYCLGCFRLSFVVSRLSIASCPLLVARCELPIGHCQLPIAYCVLETAR
jgi:hypothetical protein